MYRQTRTRAYYSDAHTGRNSFAGPCPCSRADYYLFFPVGLYVAAINRRARMKLFFVVFDDRVGLCGTQYISLLVEANSRSKVKFIRLERRSVVFLPAIWQKRCVPLNRRNTYRCSRRWWGTKLNFSTFYGRLESFIRLLHEFVWWERCRLWNIVSIAQEKDKTRKINKCVYRPSATLVDAKITSALLYYNLRYHVGRLSV